MFGDRCASDVLESLTFRLARLRSSESSISTSEQFTSLSSESGLDSSDRSDGCSSPPRYSSNFSIGEWTPWTTSQCGEYSKQYSTPNSSPVFAGQRQFFEYQQQFAHNAGRLTGQRQFDQKNIYQQEAYCTPVSSQQQSAFRFPFAQENLQVQTNFSVKSQQVVGHSSVGDEDEGFVELFRKTPKIPPPNYICHICYGRGHYIRQCPKAARDNEVNTPYQGPKQCFGMFKCEKCKRKWTSINSFSQMQQDCKKCGIGAFPYKQMKIDVALALNLHKPNKSERSE